MFFIVLISFVVLCGLSVNGGSVFPPRSPYNEIEAKALLNLAAAAYAPSPDDCVQV